MEYNFREIEKKWQDWWKENKVYKVSNDSAKSKYYVLDMFPYPSGAGLHVGHPLGYIASDIYSRYKRLKGFNVLHPMGFDSFGLPAEQYAIETGQHPAETTKKNIATFKSQLDKIGFSYDWDREVQTSDPNYYKWTQKIFLDLFNSYFCNTSKKALPITELIKKYETEGSKNFSAEQWNAFTKAEEDEWLMKRRLAFSSFGEVNWCEALGTVLANDEVVNGVSERGGHPVVKKKMRQWYLRITAYADRLLEGLERVDFSESMKEMQRNWIGRSEGAEIIFTSPPAPLQRSWRGGEQPGDEQPTKEQRTEPLLGGRAYPKYKVNDRMQFENARINRGLSTEAETLLWEQLRNSKTGFKFRRQHPVDGFIADFACLQKGLIVEVDGGYHNTPEQQEYDNFRTKELQALGFNVLRLTNEEVINNPYTVSDQIKEYLSQQSPVNNQQKEPIASSNFATENTSEFSASDVSATDVSATDVSATDVSASPLSNSVGEGPGVRCYTTRPDTIFGVDFLVLAPEHELVSQITTKAQKEEIEKYLTYVKSRSDRERQSEVKTITGAFTGAYAINPFNGFEIPIWIAEYVLAGYGTGAIMAVPCGDERDFKFAQHFNIPITNIIGEHFNGSEANPTKEAKLQNSGFLNGLLMKDAIGVAIDKIEELGIGKRKVNYKMRDAGFSRQRYWGEPFPIIWQDGIATPLNENELPLELPYVEKYGPGPEGEGPLANITDWISLPDLPKSRDMLSKGGALEADESYSPSLGGSRREASTMPGYAGSSWYFLRYMDPHNTEAFVDRKASDYWNSVDLYIGGTEHAVGHLLYSRMWTKVLYDLGYIGFDEPFKKLLNQGMITSLGYYVRMIDFEKGDGSICFLYGNDNDLRQNNISVNKYGEKFVDKEYNNNSDFKRLPYAGSYLETGNRMTRLAYKHYTNDFSNFQPPMEEDFIWMESGLGYDLDYFTIDVANEKMSKSKYNTYNPDEIVEQYGADTFRMYEMFLGPVEASKPWDTKGIEGVHRFLRKLWRLFADETKGLIVTNEKATDAELKILHKTIKKIEDDTERFSFNTAVSTFMICVNDLHDAKCHKREILEPLIILLVPYAPHIAEELYHLLNSSLPTSREGRGEVSVLDATYPKLEEKYLVESSKEYPITINGKVRSNINISLDATQPEVEQLVLQNETVQKWLEGKDPKRIVFVKGKMINVVL